LPRLESNTSASKKVSSGLDSGGPPSIETAAADRGAVASAEGVDWQPKRTGTAAKHSLEIAQQVGRGYDIVTSYFKRQSVLIERYVSRWISALS
jgi:hypothetical protein